MWDAAMHIVLFTKIHSVYWGSLRPPDRMIFLSFPSLKLFFGKKCQMIYKIRRGSGVNPCLEKLKKIIRFCGRRLPLNTDVVLLARGCSITCSMYWRPRPPWCNSTTLVPNLSIELKNKYHKITIFFTQTKTKTCLKIFGCDAYKICWVAPL